MSAASQSSAFVLPPLPELRSTTIFGCTIRYYDVGSGVPLVLIHGIGGDADDWAFCLERLSASHRVVALDLLGFGRSDKPAIDYTITGFVEVLERFLHAIGIDRATLIGHSLGGWIAASLALVSSERIDSLVLVDSAGVWGQMTSFPVDLRVSTLAHMREIFQFLFYDKALATESLIEMCYQQHLERGDGPTINTLLMNTRGGRERLDDRISGLKMPVLIVWGEQDQMIPVELGRRTQRLIPGSKLEIIPQCGHLPELEKPAELVQRVVQFLAG